MNIKQALWRTAALVLAVVAAGCGGGSDTSVDEGDPQHESALAAPAGLKASTSFVVLQSDKGDLIGGGKSYVYTQVTAVLAVQAYGDSLTVRVDGDEHWAGYFQLPNAPARLRPGLYANAQRNITDPLTRPMLNWMAQSRSCIDVKGWFLIESVRYEGDALVALDVSFEQHCERAAPALRGHVHWSAADTTTPAGPVVPAPASLWSPPAGATPATGNYIYLDSEAGDPLGGGGRTLTYTQANASIAVETTAGRMTATVTGDERWQGDFQAMNTLASLQPGYYRGLQLYPFHNPTAGGLSWQGGGYCNVSRGWFAVDQVTYVDGRLASVDLRFEQRCDGAAGALRGKIHWAVNDPTSPPGPVSPPPAGLWAPPAGATPSSGNYVYLASDTDDYVGQGRTRTYTQADSTFSLIAIERHLRVQVIGNQGWSGDFAAMSSLASLQPGYYGHLKAYGSHNPAVGGLDWSGDGRACNALTGWFVVDHIGYANGALTALDLRFEQRCQGSTGALRGQVHWRLGGDDTQPAGPVNPPPSSLWAPPTGATPATGNYVYLASDVGDYVGAGRTLTYTPADATLVATSGPGKFDLQVNGDRSWSGTFQAMSGLARLQPGYYGNLRRYPFHNPVIGGLDWSGDGRGCNTLEGWFVVDSVAYAGDTLMDIELRFEQHCEGSTPALHGKIRWSASDTGTYAGPVNPAPSGLWNAAVSATPASGNYVYLESEAGDWIGRGLSSLYTDADATLAFSGVSDGRLAVGVSTPTIHWGGVFKAMVSVKQLIPGYYGGLTQFGGHNPTKGGMDWWGGNSGSCGSLTGWFVVDKAVYVNDTLRAIDLRFEQHCDGAVPALHGKIHWVAG